MDTDVEPPRPRVARSGSDSGRDARRRGLRLVGGDAGQASPAPVKSEITKWMPKDASSEPPWNGRFVQVNVRVAKPGAMRTR